MRVAVLHVELFIPHALSLKDKRMVLRRVKDRLGKFNVAVAEFEHQDAWQRAALGIVAISTTADHVEQQLAAAADEIDRVEPGLVTRTEVEFLACPMAQGYRPQRVGDQIREELSAMLARGEVHDPKIGFITLTRVQVSPDLQVARVYYTSLGDPAARKDTQKALDRATPFLRRQIGSRVQLRRVPELEFRFDESIAHQDRIEQILQDLHQEEASRKQTDDDDVD